VSSGQLLNVPGYCLSCKQTKCHSSVNQAPRRFIDL